MGIKALNEGLKKNTTITSLHLFGRFKQKHHKLFRISFDTQSIGNEGYENGTSSSSEDEM